MPTLKENIEKWGNDYDWPERGEEWSTAWGGPSMQWYGSLLTRTQRFLPTNRVLEIASGYGRWTHFLLQNCENLIAIDISESCIEYCRNRFADYTNVEFHTNDGKSLDMVPDESVDFIFSFDSLVHADISVLEAYISQFPRVLKADGAAFLHHSNLGSYSRQLKSIDRVPKLRSVLSRMGLVDRSFHWRDPSVDANAVQAIANKNNLNCINQEIVHWGTRRTFIDCFTTIVKKSSPYSGPRNFLANDQFMKEASNLRCLANLYQRSRIAND